MTVNTLGTDPSEPERALGAGATREARTVAELLWPFLALGAALFSISALFYYHLNQADLIPQSVLQRGIAGLYHAFGLAPSVLFFLLVASWATIWFATGVLERPGARLLRLAVMAVMLGVFLNLGDGGVVPAVHKGEFGAWLAGRLVGAIGYVPTTALVWITTFASLLLATDWFFSDMFERARRPQSAALAAESGVEDAVTDHLRGLSQAVAGVSVAPDPVVDPADEIERDGRAIDADAPSSSQESAGDGPGIAPDVSSTGSAEPSRPNYAERRRLRAARREQAFAADVDSDVDAAAESEVPPVPSPESAADEPLVSEQELASLFAEGERAWGEGQGFDEVVAPDPREGTAVGPEDRFAVVAQVSEVTDEIDDVDGVGDAAVGDGAFAEEDEEVEEVEDGAEQAGGDDEADEQDEVVGWSAFALETSMDSLDPVSLPEARTRPEAEDAEIAERRPVDPTLVQAEAQEGAAGEAGRMAESSLDESTGDAPDAGAPSGMSAPAEPRDAAVERLAQEDVELAGAIEQLDDEFDAEPASSEGVSEVEPTVSIPRPEAAAPVLPRPPATRQRQLFGGADEGLLQEALDLVSGSRRATATLLQRKLRIDYELACELLSELAGRGVVEFDADSGRARVVDS